MDIENVASLIKNQGLPARINSSRDEIYVSKWLQLYNVRVKFSSNDEKVKLVNLVWLDLIVVAVFLDLTVKQFISNSSNRALFLFLLLITLIRIIQESRVRHKLHHCLQSLK